MTVTSPLEHVQTRLSGLREEMNELMQIEAALIKYHETYSGSTDTPTRQTTRWARSISDEQAISYTQAVQDAFSSDPHREWTKTEVREYVERQYPASKVRRNVLNAEITRQVHKGQLEETEDGRYRLVLNTQQHDQSNVDDSGYATEDYNEEAAE